MSNPYAQVYALEASCVVQNLEEAFTLGNATAKRNFACFSVSLGEWSCGVTAMKQPFAKYTPITLK